MTNRKILGVFFIFALLGCSSVKPEEQSQGELHLDMVVDESSHAIEFSIDEQGWETTKGTYEPDSNPLPVAQFPIPPGFPPVDQYKSHDEACREVVKKEVPKEKATWRKAINMWCEHRSYHGSRYQIIESKVDGSQIHDRDRPTAWIFYTQNVLGGVLDPDNCEYHAVNYKLKHTRNCRKLAKNWDFRNKLTDKIKRQWFGHPHDMERFGTRGPHDWPAANVYRYIPGCYPPEQMDRFDVSITATVRHSLEICEKHGCMTKWDIKKYW